MACITDKSLASTRGYWRGGINFPSTLFSSIYEELGTWCSFKFSLFCYFFWRHFGTRSSLVVH